MPLWPAESEIERTRVDSSRATLRKAYVGDVVLSYTWLVFCALLALNAGSAVSEFYAGGFSWMLVGWSLMFVLSLSEVWYCLAAVHLDNALAYSKFLERGRFLRNIYGRPSNSLTV